MREHTTESASHQRAKRKAAGSSGSTEVVLQDGSRLDAVTSNRATEVERSGKIAQLEEAAGRLKVSGKPQKVLQVPQADMKKAVEAMKEVGVKGTVKNMGGTQHRRVRKAR